VNRAKKLKEKKPGSGLFEVKTMPQSNESRQKKDLEKKTESVKKLTKTTMDRWLENWELKRHPAMKKTTQGRDEMHYSEAFPCGPAPPVWYKQRSSEKYESGE